MCKQGFIGVILLGALRSEVKQKCKVSDVLVLVSLNPQGSGNIPVPVRIHQVCSFHSREGRGHTYQYSPIVVHYFTKGFSIVPLHIIFPYEETVWANSSRIILGRVPCVLHAPRRERQVLLPNHVYSTILFYHHLNLNTTWKQKLPAESLGCWLGQI